MFLLLSQSSMLKLPIASKAHFKRRSTAPGGYSIYPWVGRCGAAPHTLTLFKTNIADFPTLFSFSMILEKTQTAYKDLMAPSSASISAPYCGRARVGTCGQPGYVFRDFCLKQGIEFIIFCLNQGIDLSILVSNRINVLNRVSKIGILS